MTKANLHITEEQNMEISKIIKQRILDKGSKFHSNDSIAEFINEGELELLVDEVEYKFRNVLESLVIDIKSDHNTQDTARRVAKMYIHEVFAGRYTDKPPVTAFPNASNYDQLYTVGPISIRSTCAHHFQNITGSCYIGIFPGESVIGLSKFNRLIDHIASRPTIQEELTTQIADEIERVTEAKGVAVVLKASHACMTHRGVKEPCSDMTTSIVRGSLREDAELKKEFFKLLSGMKGYNS